ncbi:MAG: bifunctional nicotinamidase/pyrazinamidase [Leptospiraceae bacterium]|nr:bifunctional nicotinamidase/pyrazinamidase [Leptospiraceae bacterium]MDW7975065.1 bifunctional nicotinamidase/pyrazinamidase [Leptospiraceae bacterium]
MKALILIDVQNDFMPYGALPVPKGDEIVPVINRIIEKFSLVVATQDWHPKNHISFASNHAGKKPFDVIDLDGYPQTLWPDHCVQETKGADFHPALNTKPIETIFRKGTNPNIDSYSGFFDNLHKKSTGLAGFLREKEAKELYFAGLAADYCVYYSIKDAVQLGFDCVLIEDATRAIDEKQFQNIKEELQKHNVKFIQSKDLE